MKKIDMQQARQGVKVAGEVVACGLLIFASYIKLKNDGEKLVGYDDAVEAIMSSSMFSNDKCEAVKAVKQNMGEYYYKSILSIMESSMFGAEKVEMIRYLSEE